MAGALLYSARYAVQPPALDVTTHPDFVLPDVSGTEHDFSEWAGKNRIVNFWATWCAPCRREIPLLKAFQDEHGSNGFQIIGIAVDFPEPVAHYAEAAEFNYPILVGEQDAMAVAESSGIEFIGLPFTMFVASDGELVGAYIGELHQSHLDTVVDVMTRLDRAEISKQDAQATLRDH
jgi:thiol-disulfide isomerase/thioredoxin